MGAPATYRTGTGVFEGEPSSPLHPFSERREMEEAARAAVLADWRADDATFQTAFRLPGQEDKHDRLSSPVPLKLSGSAEPNEGSRPRSDGSEGGGG